MNLTSQYIVNTKSRDAYLESLATYKSIRTTSTRLRMSDDRCVLNNKKQGTFQVGTIVFNMLYCPTGQFIMGSNEREDPNKGILVNCLKKLVVIERPFLLGETEVTQELFEKIMGFNPSEYQGERYPNSKQRPVENITWYDAVKFCNKLSEKLRKKPYYNITKICVLRDCMGEVMPNHIGGAEVTINPHANGFRLPYEKEWEYAAKAGTDNQWAGTNNVNQLGKVAWFNKNSKDQTHPIKCKLPNEWGFYDMSGNVGEWCYDLYDSNSTIPLNSEARVIRGGDTNSPTTHVRTILREGDSPSSKMMKGIRIAL